MPESFRTVFSGAWTGGILVGSSPSGGRAGFVGVVALASDDRRARSRFVSRLRNRQSVGRLENGAEFLARVLTPVSRLNAGFCVEAVTGVEAGAGGAASPGVATGVEGCVPATFAGVEAGAGGAAGAGVATGVACGALATFAGSAAFGEGVAVLTVGGIFSGAGAGAFASTGALAGTAGSAVGRGNSGVADRGLVARRGERNFCVADLQLGLLEKPAFLVAQLHHGAGQILDLIH